MDFFACLAIASLAVVGIVIRDGCPPSSKSTYQFFASKTSYDQVRGEFKGRVELHGDCHAKHFYYLSRHGTRVPPRDDCEYMRKHLPRLRDNILHFFQHGKSLLDDCVTGRLRRWKLPVVLNGGGLTPEGKEEQTQIARRYRARFPSLFDNDSQYDIRYMTGDRIVSSLRYFLKGLLGKEAINGSRIIRDDKLLFFDEHCPKWNATTVGACKSKKKYIYPTLKRISRRLGYRNTLSFEDVEVMYNACRYETSWFPNVTSPWCGLFTKEDLQELEYEKDKDFYCRYGYEHAINYQLACPVLEDLINNIRKIAQDEEDSSSVHIRFTHSGGIVKFFSRMGFFNDSRSIYGADYKERSWRTSFMDPFSSNLAFVLVKCGNKFKLLSYLQENEFRLPACKEWPCDLQQFLNHYANIANECNLNELCNI